MSTEKSRKIIVAGAMAGVVAIGGTLFALRSHPVTEVVQTPPPPASVTQTPASELRAEAPADTPPPLAQTPDVAAVEPQPSGAAPATNQHSNGSAAGAHTATAAAVEHKSTRKPHTGRRDADVMASDSSAARRLAALESTDTPSAKADPANGGGAKRHADAAKSADGLKSGDTVEGSDAAKAADESTPAITPTSMAAPAPVISGTPPDDQKAGTSTERAAPDSQTPPQ